MKLNIDGIGKIFQSSIDIDGLTIISGENDTGKSTVGKVLFSIIQAFTTFPYIFEKQTREKFQREFERLYYEIRRLVDITDNSEIRNLFSFSRGAVGVSDVPPHVLLNILKKQIESLSGDNIEQFSRQKLINSIERLRVENASPDKEDKIIRHSLNKVLASEFPADVVCKTTDGVAKIELIDGASRVLDFTVDKGGIKDFTSSGPLGFKNVTLVDGPSILQYYPAISEFDSVGEKRLRRGALPFHVVDLAGKIQGVKRNIDLLGEISINRFPGAISGDLRYDEKSHGFIYETDKYSIQSNNVASGIKALALVDLLIIGEYVNAESLLVLDEPETNLHPSWQVQYAKVICDLVRGGAKILLNTHSPYMLEALKGYSAQIDGVNFYVSKLNEKGYAEFHNTNGDITPILEVLSQPLIDLVNELSE
ncbi:AAA family ATPase [Xylophilus sp. Leaf220]|uniref:AAA family ATPase n=1 Tax=Xylophilus sp. Leaf220 TaxID=1735686 RepID=UPI0009EC7536|nr:AAA family ATPase [Xylophilus sp. Leaf220]